MGKWVKDNRIILTITCALILLVAAGSLFYLLCAHRIVQAMYEGRSAGILNRIIQKPIAHPLEFYYDRAHDMFARICLFLLSIAICILSFGLWLRHRPGRKLFIAAALLFVLLVSCTLFDAVRINIKRFTGDLTLLVSKSQLLRNKAHGFNEQIALANLGNSEVNDFYYRFDDHIDTAMHYNHVTPPEKVKQAGFKNSGFEFNGIDIAGFKPKEGKSVIENGTLRLRYRKDDYLYNTEEINVPVGEVGAIEIRMKSKEGTRMTLACAEEAAADLGDREHAGSEIYTISTTTLPDSVFHTYSIDSRNLFGKYFRAKEQTVKKVFLVPSNIEGDEVEIDFIRFVPLRSKFKDPYGTSYEILGDETRKVLYMKTPLCLRYSVSMPDREAFLDFGIGVLEANAPATCSITIEGGGARKKIFSKEVRNTDAWNDITIDLAEWRGEPVEVEFTVESEKGNIVFLSNPLIYEPLKEKLNVIIVLEDALRADHLSCYGYPRKTTPVKDEFIKDGVLFLNAFSQSTMTRSSTTSFMTSLYPSATGVWNLTDALDDRFLTLAEIMRSQGFATAEFIQSINTGPGTGGHQGFSYISDNKAIGERAQGVYDKDALAWIDSQQGRNFFIYMHIIDPHMPYDPPKPFDEWYRNAPRGAVPADKKTRTNHPEWAKNPTQEGLLLLYDGEIRYNDYWFQRFLNGLQERRLTDDTLIIFIADHGEHQGEHGIWGHYPPTYIQTVHVPLLMVYPAKLPKGLRLSQPVQLIDIMPTILELAGIDTSGLLLQGDSLVELISGKNKEYWDNRICVSEELFLRSKDDKIGWASLFYRNLHMVNSDQLNDALSRVMEYLFIGGLHDALLSTRTFNYGRDKDEKRFFNSFLFDAYLAHWIRSSIESLQSNNEAIRTAVTGGQIEEIKLDSDQQEQLRALGYLQ